MRRLAALAGILLLLALAGTLLWKVWRHHNAAEPYAEEPAVVRLDGLGGTDVKISSRLR